MARRTSPALEPVAAPLFDDAPTRLPSILSEIPTRLIDAILGHNPRQDFGDHDGSFAGLVASIRRDGILLPLLVTDHPQDSDRWALVAGHRRLSAAKTVGLERVPCVVLPPGTTDPGHLVALALTENLQRRDLNPLEEAEGYQRLESLGWSQEAIGRTVGRSQSVVSRALSLLGLPTGTRTMLREGLLSASHGAELVPMLGAGVPTEDLDALAGKAAEHGWSVGTLRVNAQSLVDRERGRERAAQTTLLEDDAQSRDYATSHNGAGSSPTGSDALTRPAGMERGAPVPAAPEVKPGYTQADAKAEYEASQRPDPDETTPVKDAFQARLERLTPGADTDEGGGWDATGRMTAAERAAWLEESDLTIAEAIDNLRASEEAEEDGDDLRIALDEESQGILQLLAQDYSARTGRLLREDSWIDQVFGLIQDAARDRELLAAGGMVIGLTPEDAGRLRRIADDMGEEPQEMLTAMLTVRAKLLDDQAATARALPPLEKGSDRWVLWQWRRAEGEEVYRHVGPVIVGRKAHYCLTLIGAESDAREFSRDDWVDEEADTVIGIGHQIYHGEQFGERAATYWHRGECVEVRQSNGELRIVGGEA